MFKAFSNVCFQGETTLSCIYKLLEQKYNNFNFGKHSNTGPPMHQLPLSCICRQLFIKDSSRVHVYNEYHMQGSYSIDNR